VRVYRRPAPVLRSGDRTCVASTPLRSRASRPGGVGERAARRCGERELELTAASSDTEGTWRSMVSPALIREVVWRKATGMIWCRVCESRRQRRVRHVGGVTDCTRGSTATRAHDEIQARPSAGTSRKGRRLSTPTATSWRSTRVSAPRKNQSRRKAASRSSSISSSPLYRT
jgi:hypothetical protein